MKKDIFIDAAVKTFLIILVSIILGGLISALFSCRSARQAQADNSTNITENITHTSSHVSSDRTSLRADTLLVRDSVFVIQRNDTTIIREFHFRDRTKMMATAEASTQKSDSTATAARTITTIRTVTQQVKAPLRWWQKSLITLGGIALAAAALWISVKIAPRIIRK